MLVLFYTTLAVASETATTSCKLCYSAILREVLRTIWTTFETAVRGFLLGFGAAILKDLLVDKKGSAETTTDFTHTLRFARVAGLGSACFVTGVALFLPARLRAEMFMIP